MPMAGGVILPKKNKIVLIRPPDTDVLDAEREHPHGLLVLASLIRNAEVKVLDLGNAGIDSYKNVPYADIYGITSVTPSFYDTIKFANLLKSKYPTSKFILGGIHASALPHTIDRNLFNTIVVGQCEGNINQLLTQSGICYGDVLPDLSSIFPLRWDLIDVEKYISKRNYHPIPRIIGIMFGRGCVHRCAFCYNTGIPKTLQHVNPTVGIRELKMLLKQYHPDGFMFMDDNSGGYIKEYSSELKKMGCYWGISTSLYYSHNFLSYINDGCQFFSLGIESGSDQILQRMNKPNTTKKIVKVIKSIKKAGAIVRILLIAGFPGETEETVDETVSIINSLPLDDRDTVRIWTCIPYPGTPLFIYPEKFGITWLSDNLADYRSKGKERKFKAAFRTESLSPSDIISLANRMEEGIHAC